MTHTHTRGDIGSEKGMALIMVLLLLAVVASLATGLTMNGRVEVAMAHNETHYAGARAAAEAGLNRAIEAIRANTTDDLLAVYTDTGDVSFLLTEAAPYVIGTNGEYSYVLEILDDDDPVLHLAPLTPAQLASMSEDGDPLSNTNERLILRATGLGPNGTSVRISRVLETVGTPQTTTTTTITNPALLVNGDLVVTGSIEISGLKGNVHANGDIDISGNSYAVSGDATAVGTFTAANADQNIGGVYGGSRPTINVPDIDANNYIDQATHILKADGTIQAVGTAPACVNSCGWSFNSGTWRITNADQDNASSGTFFAEGNVVIAGSPNGGSKSTPLALSVIALGSISVTGNPTLRPENALALQFVTNGDLKIHGNVDTDDPQVEGQSLVRNQLHVGGNPDLRGQIIVQDLADCAEPCSNLTDLNAIVGNMDIVYDGSFGDLISELVSPPVTSYVNNVAGWMEIQ